MKPETNVNDKEAWERAFIQPIAKIMKERGIRELVIIINPENGKASYFMEPEDGE
jgi:hypothetical protein